MYPYPKVAPFGVKRKCRPTAQSASINQTPYHPVQYPLLGEPVWMACGPVPPRIIRALLAAVPSGYNGVKLITGTRKEACGKRRARLPVATTAKPEADGRHAPAVRAPHGRFYIEKILFDTTKFIDFFFPSKDSVPIIVTISTFIPNLIFRLFLYQFAIT